jgi:hypothetical protein
MDKHLLDHPESIRLVECPNCFTNGEFLGMIEDAEWMASLPKWSSEGFHVWQNPKI